jgi:NADPH-dependent 2,4-dienoyl-CoA reductase/sulfur reductase-like enzyme
MARSTEPGGGTAASGGWSRRRLGKLAVAAGFAAVSGQARRPSLAAAKAKPKVVVLGGGPGGATAAKLLAASRAGIQVTLVEANPAYTACYFSNHYLAGLRSYESLRHDYGALGRAHGVRVVHDRAMEIDPVRKAVRLRDGAALPYDRLIAAPGIEIMFDAIPGYGEQAADAMPHAWELGSQIRLLKRQLQAMADGGTFLIAPPPEPARCPPGPYERVCMVAHYLKHEKPRSKIVILDAKDKFAKQKLFEDGWARFYPDMIEWLPAEFTGGVTAVDPKAMRVMTEDETFEAAVANIIPPQRAGRIARQAGLADESGWCPVDAATLASKLQPDIHLVGDAIVPGDMPKSATSAHSQARACALAVHAALSGTAAAPPGFDNTCWSLIAADHAVKVGGAYRAAREGIAKTSSFISQADEDDGIRAATAREAAAWYAAFAQDVFG